MTKASEDLVGGSTRVCAGGYGPPTLFIGHEDGRGEWGSRHAYRAEGTGN